MPGTIIVIFKVTRRYISFKLVIYEKIGFFNGGIFIT